MFLRIGSFYFRI